MTNFAAISPQMQALAREVPSWAYGNSGTRFKVFGSPGTPRTVEEKIADAAAGNPVTGPPPRVAPPPGGEDRRRSGGHPGHRPRAQRRAAHPLGPGRRLLTASQARGGARRDA